MFAFDRSAVAVLAPLALLVAVVLYSNLAPTRTPEPAAAQRAQSGEPARDQTVAANLPSR